MDSGVSGSGNHRVRGDKGNRKKEESGKDDDDDGSHSSSSVADSGIRRRRKKRWGHRRFGHSRDASNGRTRRIRHSGEAENSAYDDIYRTCEGEAYSGWV